MTLFFPSLTSALKSLYGQRVFVSPGRTQYTFSDTHPRTHAHGRTLLDERLARRRDLYLTTRNTHNRQTYMSQAGFEPAIPASERS